MKKITFLLIAFITIMTQAQQNQIEPKKVIIGANASEDVLPDLNTLNINITERDKDYDDVSEKLTSKIQTVVAALVRAGIKKDNIKSNSYNIYEDFVYTNNKRKSNGFVASTNLYAEFPKDAKLVGKIMKELYVDDASVSVEASFKVSDKLRQEVGTKLRKQAMVNAKSTATDLTEAVGEKITGLYKVVYNTVFNSYQAVPSAMMRTNGNNGMDAVMEESFDNNPREVTIREEVSTEWLIQ